MDARAQVRQRMAEHEQQELYLQTTDTAIPKILSKDSITGDEQIKLHFFLLSAMRQREWEWFQYKDGVISQDVYKAYHGVIAIHLGTDITRTWWGSVGSIGFDKDFVNEVGVLLETSSTPDYYKQISRYV